MTIQPISYPPVPGNPYGPQDQTIDTTQASKQSEAVGAQKPQGVLPGDGRFDSYEKSDGRLSASASGVYRLAEDESGNPKILFDAPGRAAKASGEPSSAEGHPAGDEAPDSANGSASPDGEPETTQCTTNTDKVDAEIKKLREEKKQLLQQLRQAAGDEEKQADLQRRLSQLEAELLAKDNDAYRKQHATYTTEAAQ